jgi:ammonia channel protein AmtB
LFMGDTSTGMHILYWLVLQLYLRIDDPMDSAPVHLGSGILGTILIGFLARPSYVNALTEAQV